MTKEQFNSVCEWQRETFPAGTALSKTHHLMEEVDELGMDILLGDEPAARHELADCFILLFGIADRLGLSHEDVCEAIEDKMKINRARKWGTPDVNGVVKHVE